MYIPSQDAIYHRYFQNKLPKNEELPPLIDLIHNVSLVLLNSHPAIQYPRPHVPNMIQVGGMHINNTQNTRLSEHIDDYITAAPNGVIYMNLGSVIKSCDLPNEQIMAFIKTFEQYVGKMRIIWKWENATMTNQPSNVIIGNWMPQELVLGKNKKNMF